MMAAKEKARQASKAGFTGVVVDGQGSNADALCQIKKGQTEVARHQLTQGKKSKKPKSLNRDEALKEVAVVISHLHLRKAGIDAPAPEVNLVKGGQQSPSLASAQDMQDGLSSAPSRPLSEPQSQITASQKLESYKSAVEEVSSALAGNGDSGHLVIEGVLGKVGGGWQSMVCEACGMGLWGILQPGSGGSGSGLGAKAACGRYVRCVRGAPGLA